MSKVQTAAEVAESLKHCIRKDDDDNVWFAQEYATPILEEWAKQHQPQPDASDEALARQISTMDNIVFIPETEDGDNTSVIRNVSSLIARHTAAKVAEAEERGWNRGAKAMQKECVAQIKTGTANVPKYERQIYACVADDIESLPLPPYQKKGE